MINQEEKRDEILTPLFLNINGFELLLSINT